MTQSKLFRILYVEDMPEDAELCLRTLRKAGLQITADVVSAEEDFRRLLESRSYDVVLSDYHMPGWNGMQALELLKRSAKDIPFILVTGTIGEETLVECVKQGAADYIQKDMPARLPAAIRRALEEKAAREERARMGQALRESEERYRRLFHESTSCITVHEMDPGGPGRIVDVNDTMVSLLGYPRDELLKMTPADLGPPGLPLEESALQAEKLQRGERIVFERPVLAKDGTQRILEFQSKPFAWQGSLRVLSEARDVTERRSAEQRIRILSEAVERSPSLIILTDAQARIVYANPKFTEVTGYTLEEILGRNPRFLKGSETPPDEYRKLWQTVTRGGVWRGEFHNRKKNGELYWAECMITALRNYAGEITHYLGVQEDLTERRKMEEEKRMLEEQFRQAQKMEAIGQLSGGIAHDFNNLLGVIIGFNELLQERIQGDEVAHKYIAQIRKAGDSAVELIHHLLAFSREQVLEPRVLDLNCVLSELGEMLPRLINEDIMLLLVAPPDLGRVKADPGQIEQVILNLAVNARDAMPHGGKLTIETANVELDENYAREHIAVVPGRYVMLAVSDTGVGMEPVIQARIFEPFFTTKELGKGTGLGLATVYGIVKQSGGNIWVYSEPAKGTTFKIYLPRVDAKADLAAVPASRHAATGGSETIFLVEDAEELRSLVREVLDCAGYTVLQAADGREAVRIAEQLNSPIHLLLTDVVMPGMSGRDVAEQVVRRHPETRVLYMSGYTDSSIVHHGVLEEGVALLSKPFTRERLLRKIRHVLDPSG
jgi:two-component system cell cycle sensor histidine kinase/response regulator CckA